MHYDNDKRSSRFIQCIVLLVCFLVICFPNLKVGIVVDTINPIIYLTWCMLFLYMIKVRFTLNLDVLDVFFICFFLFYSVYILLGPYDEVRAVAESLLPKQWLDMYSHNIEYFYNTKKNAIFQLVNLLVYYLFYKFGMLVAKQDKAMIYSILNFLLFTIIFQFILSFFQVLYGESGIRAYGSVGNAQNLGALSILIMITCLFFSKIKSFKLLVLGLTFGCIILSGTRSSLVVYALLLLLIYMPFKFTLIIFWISLVLNFFIAILISPLLDSTGIIEFIGVYTSSYTLVMRFLMWGSFFELFNNNFLIGLGGVIPRFSENVIWYFALPYGFFGILAYSSLLYRLLNRGSKFNYIFGVYIFTQGLTFYGFLVGNLGLFFWFLFGFISVSNDEYFTHKKV